MKCLRCGGENEAQAKFCEHCGTKLFSKCPQCGNQNIARKKFCPKCGAHLQLLFLTKTMETNHKVQELHELNLDAELDLYKEELKRGATIVTCSHCAVKNRVPKEKDIDLARCGKCGKRLAFD